MSEVTQKICDGCGVAGKQGEPVYTMNLALARNGDVVKSKAYDLHANSKCVKALFRKLGGEADQMLLETLAGGSATD